MHSKRSLLGRLPLLGVPLVAMSLVFACTQKKEPSSPEAALSKQEKIALEDYKAEVEIGRDMAGRLLAFYGSLDDKQLLGYLNQVGGYVGSYSDDPERRYMFAVIRSESINAFACPGGYVLITMGTLRNVRNEAELAAVLGHEVAHVGKKHMFDTLKNMNQKQLDENAEAGEAASKASPAVAMRKRPKVKETEAGNTLVKFLSSSSGTSLNLLQAAKAGMNLIMEKGLDQKLEYEADHEGVKYAIRAGYAPKAMLNFLERVHKKQAKQMKQLGKTHPSVPERKKRIRDLLAQLKANQIIGARGEARVKKMKNWLPEIEK